MMEKGTMTPFPVKMSVKGEGAGGPLPSTALLNGGKSRPNGNGLLTNWTLTATSPEPYESTKSRLSRDQLLWANLVGSSSTGIFLRSWMKKINLRFLLREASEEEC